MDKILFYTGMFMALFILTFIMNYAVFKPFHTNVRVSWFDITIMSLIISMGIILMYIGVFG